MTFYDDVENGLVKATLILAVPRSVSTALGRALSQSPDIDSFLMQPFGAAMHEGIEPIQLIDQELEALKKVRRPTPEDPIHIVIKEMGYELETEDLAELARRCENVIILCRDPLAQTYSHAKVYEKLGGRTLADKSGLHRLRYSLGDAEQSLVSQWRGLTSHFHFLAAPNLDAADAKKEPNLIVLDGDLMRAMPENTLKRTAKKLGIRYSNRMVGGWHGLSTNEAELFSTYSDAYMSTARESKGVIKPQELPPTLSEFPHEIRLSAQANLINYTTMLASPHTVRPKLNRIFADEASGDEKGSGSPVPTALADTCPVTAYALTATASKRGKRSEEVLQAIRKKFPQYNESFGIIDSVVFAKKAQLKL